MCEYIEEYALEINTDRERLQPERALFRAVLWRLILDAINPSQNKKIEEDILDARHWLKNCPNSFVAVCELAGYNPVWIRENVVNGILENVK